MYNIGGNGRWGTYAVKRRYGSDRESNRNLRVDMLGHINYVTLTVMGLSEYFFDELSLE
jgi:hypothetical protein